MADDAEPTTSTPPSPPRRTLPYRPPARDAKPEAGVGPWAAAGLGWLLPGLGHFLTPGERWRGVAGGLAVLALFVLGLLIGGVRVVDVPGYRDGQKLVDRGGRWIVTAQPLAAVRESPWYLGQVFVGPVNLLASYASVTAAAAGYPKPTARLGEIGTLYCAVAGMLNFVLILDAHGRAGQKPRVAEGGEGGEP